MCAESCNDLLLDVHLNTLNELNLIPELCYLMAPLVAVQSCQQVLCGRI